MDNYNCAAGGCACGAGAPSASAAPQMQNYGSITQRSGVAVPSMDDIAGYSNMTPAQQEQQKQMLAQAGNTLMPGMPGYRAQNAAGNGGAESAVAPLTPTMAQMGAITGDNLQYLNGFLRTQIGRPVLVTFLIGTNTLTDRSGILLGVGINYILINETQTDDVLACDFYNIKFIRFYY